MSRATRTQAKASSAGELFPIRTVSSLTGVNPVTLRAWERRYGLIRPARAPSGHRLYRREEIDLVHRAQELLSKGISISQVRQALETQRGDSHKTRETWWDRCRQRLVAAIERFDEDAVDRAYNDALALHPVEVVTEKLLLPLLMELGERWEKRQGSVVEEHFFSTYLRNKIGARFHHRAGRSMGSRLLAACLPGEHHEIGLLLFALAAHDAGLRPVVLGADAPLRELALAARRAQCSAIVLSGSTAPAPEVLSVELGALVASASVPVFVGGLCSIREHDAIVAAGATPLGIESVPAVQRILSAVASEQVPARESRQPAEES